MRIQSFNAAISSIARTARNTVAAGLVAASPMSAKVAKADPAPLSKTNIVEMTSCRNQGIDNGIEPIIYFNSYTNNLPSVASTNLAQFTKFKVATDGTIRIEGVVPGYAPVVSIYATHDLKVPFKKFDTLWNPLIQDGSTSTTTKAYKDTSEAATKFVADLEATTNRFFMFSYNAIDDKTGKIIATDANVPGVTKVNCWYDENDQLISQ